MTSPRPERLEELERQVSALAAGCLSEAESEEVRLLLRRWRRISVFFDGLGWVGRHTGRLATWIAVIWAAIEIISRIKS